VGGGVKPHCQRGVGGILVKEVVSRMTGIRCLLFPYGLHCQGQGLDLCSGEKTRGTPTIVLSKSDRQGGDKSLPSPPTAQEE